MNPVEIEFLMKDNLTPGMEKASVKGEELDNTLEDVSRSVKEMESSKKILPGLDDVSLKTELLADRVTRMNKAMATTDSNSALTASKRFDSLGVSVQQVVREMPAATMGMNMFFLAISNNLPILADNIKTAKREYADMVAQGKEGTPVAQQLLKSVLSWQTAMMAGITILSMYGKDIANWASELFYAKDAMDALSKSVGEANVKMYAEQGNILSLFIRLKQATQGSKEYQSIKDEIISKYGTYLSGLDKEFSSLNDVEQAYLAVSKAALQAAKDRAIASVSEDAEKDYAKYWEKNIPKVTDVLKKQGYTKEQISNYLQYLYSGVGNKYGQFNNMSRDVFKENQSVLKDIQSNRADFYKQIQDINEKFDFGSDEVAKNNKAHLEAIRKNLVAKLENMDESVAKSDVGKKLKAQIDAIDEQINKAYGLRKKTDTQTSSRINAVTDANEKVETAETNAARERSRLVVDLENQVEQARIDSMSDGILKTLAQRDLNNKKELETVTREKEDKIKAYVQAQKEIFDAQEDAKAKNNKKYKKRTFDSSTVDTSGIESQYASIYSYTELTQSQKYMNDLLETYKDNAAQRLEIEKKYNNDLMQLQEQRNKAAVAGDENAVSLFDRAIAKATADKGKALMSFDFDRLKESPDYIRAFEDLRNTSSETLNSLLKQLEDAKATAAQVLNPEDLREYTSTIQDIMNELETRNPFQALAQKQKELAEAERELVAAKKQMDYVNAGGQIVVDTISSHNADGSLHIDKIYKTSAQAVDEYRVAKDKYTKANNNFLKAETTAAEKVEELASSIKNVGDSIGGTSGEIISFIGDILSFASQGIKAVEMTSKVATTALSTMEKASVILAIISAAIQLMQKLDDLIGDAHDSYEKYADKVAEINKLTDAVNEYKLAVLEANQKENSWFGEDKLQSLRDYKEIQQAALQALIDKMAEAQAIYQNESGGGWLTTAGQLLTGQWFSDTVLGTNFTGKDYQEGMTAAINNLRIETRKKSSGFLGSGIGGKSQQTEDLQTWINNNKDLFDGLDTNLVTKDGLLNSELVDSILNNYGDKLVGQTKETLEALKELQDKYDEYLEQLHEYVSNLYEPLVDDFVSSIWDWLDSGKDALDSFKDYASSTFKDIVTDMIKTIVLKKIFDNESVWGTGESYQSRINSLYDQYVAGKMTESQLSEQILALTNTLTSTATSQMPAIESILSAINSSFSAAGYNLLSSSTTTQSGKSGTGITATEEGVNRLEGLYTAMLENTIGLGDKVENVVSLMNDALAVLGKIEINTGASADHLSGIKTAINQMKDDISVLKRDGIKTL